MPDVVQERAGVPVLVCDPDGPPVATVDDALDLIGDISRHAAASPALRALVRESNAGGHVWFVPDLDALDTRLGTLA